MDIHQIVSTLSHCNVLDLADSVCVMSGGEGGGEREGGGGGGRERGGVKKSSVHNVLCTILA